MFVRKSLRQVAFTLVLPALMLAACNMGATPPATVDVNAVNTAAVATAMGQLSAQFTQTALAAPLTPIPTNTAMNLTTAVPATAGSAVATSGLPTLSFNNTPVGSAIPGFTQLASSPIPPASGSGSTASGCNDALFLGETLPDKSEVQAGKDFSKSWQLQNNGTCKWDIGYVFAFLATDSTSGIAGYDVAIKNTDETTQPGHSQTFVVKLVAPTTPGEYFGYWKLKDKEGKFFGPRVYLDIIVK